MLSQPKPQGYLSRQANQGQQSPFPSALNLRQFYQELRPILTESSENLC